MKGYRYSSGEVVALRELWDNKIWAARPVIVVQDTDKLLVFYLPAGTWIKRHVSSNGKSVSVIEKKLKKWKLADEVNNSSCSLRIKKPDENYSVLAFFNTDHDNFLYWYINLETPFRRTSVGFDYTDHVLDLIVGRNLRDWHWDDEDELQEALDAGLISPEDASSLYKKGEEVRDLLTSGDSVYTRWQNWRPEPSWEIPVLPEGWDTV